MPSFPEIPPDASPAASPAANPAANPDMHPELTPELRRLIERHADGELSPAETASLESRLARDPGLAGVIEAELADRARFRSSVDRAMRAKADGAGHLMSHSDHSGRSGQVGQVDREVRSGDLARSGPAGRAPEALRKRIVDAMAAETVHERIAAASARQRNAGRWAAAPNSAQRFSQVNYGAVAASLALVGGAVLFGIFGPRVAERPPLPGNVSVTEVAARLMSEYAACSSEGTCSGQGQPWRSREEAQMELTRLLNRPVVVPDLEAAGFSFCSGGPSCVPGACERSAQLLYCRPDDSGERCQWLSVHLVPVETPYLAYDPFGRSGPLQCGIDYSLITSTGGEMHYWCDGVVTWFVTPGAEIEFDALRRAFPA